MYRKLILGSPRYIPFGSNHVQFWPNLTSLFDEGEYEVEIQPTSTVSTVLDEGGMVCLDIC